MNHTISILILTLVLFAAREEAVSTQSTSSDTDELVVVHAVHVNDTLVRLTEQLPLDSARVDQFMENLLRPYWERGHYFARARIAGLNSVANGERILEVAVSPGPVLMVRRMVFVGLSRTGTDRLRRLFTVDPGSPITPSLLDRVAREARQIDFIDYVPPTGLRLVPGYTEADLELTFRERQQVSFFGGGGYIPDDEAGFVWNARLSLNNLFGGGRRASIRSARPDRGRTELSMQYAQPLFWLGRDRGEVGASTRDYRDDFYEFAASARYTTRVAPLAEISSGLSFRRVELAGAGGGYSAYATEVALDWLALEQPLNAVDGLRFHTSLAYIYRRYGGSSAAGVSGRAAFNETRTGIDIEWYSPSVASAVLHIGLHYRGLETGQQVPPNAELFLVGGPSTLRGYRTDQFAAQRTAFGTIEPRYRFTSGYVFWFYDAAYLNQPGRAHNGNSVRELFRHGYGFGISLLSDVRAVRVSFGWREGAAIDEPQLSVEFSADI